MKEQRITFRIDEELYKHLFVIKNERGFESISTTIRHILEHFLMNYYLSNNMKERINKENEIRDKFFSKYLNKKVIREILRNGNKTNKQKRMD